MSIDFIEVENENTGLHIEAKKMINLEKLRKLKKSIKSFILLFLDLFCFKIVF